MRKRLALVLSVAAATGSLVLAAAPADAGQGVTFDVTAGLLTISQPADKALGTAAAGTATLSATLGTVTVTDGRGALAGTWTATVASTNFTTGLASTEETILKDSIDYWSGLATSTSGTAVFVPGQPLVVNKQALSVSRTAYSATGVVGVNQASWVPTVVVNIPAQAVAGTYSGTITHSVTGA
ncbi:MAG: hypothetical protein QOE45_1335 [Frankiaceae bacterium]|jgi:hypothetical protein|nr:hypothetical protein [Frankiaceae bacterium]